MVLRRPLIILAIIAAVVVTIVVVQQVQTVRPVGDGTGSATPAASSPVRTPVPSSPAVAVQISPTYQGPAYNPEIARSPTRDKPQSKLWFHDGLWWGSLFDGELNAFTVWWLDAERHEWISTGTIIDDRPFARQDVLWDGEVLVTISHGSNQESARHAVRVRQFTYDAANRAWLPTPNFPVTVTAGGVEAASLARDGDGRLWAAFIQDGRVGVVAGGEGDLVWSPIIRFRDDSALVGVDQAAIVTVGPDIGVIWSNQLRDNVFFALHETGRPVEEWQPAEIALDGVDAADDHISVRSLDGPGGTWVYAAVKTSLDDAENRNELDPQVLVLARSPDGTWSAHTFGRVMDHHTRPILVLDSEHREALVFATSPFDGGEIFMKRTALDRISFPVGLGTPVITGPDNPHFNNATATHQSIGSDGGLVVLATDDSLGRYFFVELGDLPAPREPLPAVVTERQVVNLTFDGMAAGLDMRSQGFQVTPQETATLTVADFQGSAVARLDSPDGEPARLCRRITDVSGGMLSASAAVRVDHAPAGNAAIMSLRTDGEELTGLRVLDNGRWAYRIGPDREVTDVPWQPDTWYRITLTANVDAATYTAVVSNPDGEALLTLADLDWQTAAGPVDEICIAAPRSAAAGTLFVDDFLVEATGSDS